MSEEQAQKEPAVKPKPRPVLWVKLDGEGVRPDRVPIGLLSRALGALGRLVADPSEATPKEKDTQDPGPFQLVRIRSGSAVYALSGHSAGTAIERLRLVGLTIDDPGSAPPLDFSLGALGELSSVAARLKCQVIISDRRDGDRSILARIGPESARSLADALLVEGETSLFGTVKRVGGVTAMKCGLRVPSQDKLVYCRVEGARLARKLGRALYQDVVVSGTATWVRTNWHIHRFTIRAMEQPEQGDIATAFDAIREAGASDWDAIPDPAAYLEDDPWER